MKAKQVLLSYDVEEFDMCFEYNGTLPLEEQVMYSTNGLQLLLAVLDQYQIKVTFYCTAVYALAKPEIIKMLAEAGHEIASHTYYHSSFKNEDLKKSKQVLESITGKPVYGLRMPRMMAVDAKEVTNAGYQYNSSINPTYLPGRYNNLKVSRTSFLQGGVLQFPASVSPLFRFPMFWLSFHNAPFWLYWYFFKQTINKDGYANIYFHPWEFIDYRDIGGAKFPSYVTKNCGEQMIVKTKQLIECCLKKGFVFNTTYDYLKRVINYEL
jgi:hypothetical protein